MPAAYDYNRAVHIFHEARRNAAARDAAVAHSQDTWNTTVGTATQPPPRPQEYLQCAVETMEALSTHCPLTPLLWIQYGRTMYDYYLECCRNSIRNDSSNTIANSNSNSNTNRHDTTIEIAAQQLEYQILQLGVHEFPGSAFLQLRTVTVQIQIWMLQMQQSQRPQPTPQLDDTNTNHIEILFDALHTILQQVGRGSHRNEDYIIVLLYRLQVMLLLFQYYHRNHHINNKSQNDHNCNDDDDTAPILDDIYASLLQRSQCPMRTMNQNLRPEVQTILLAPPPPPLLPVPLLKQPPPQLWDDMEGCRRTEARMYQPFQSYEDAMDRSLYETDQIAIPRFVPHLIDIERYDTIRMMSGTTTTTNPTEVLSNRPENNMTSSSVTYDASRTQFLLDVIQSLCQEYIRWDVLLELDPTSGRTCGMGWGSLATAQIVLQYVQAIKQHLWSKVNVTPHRSSKNKTSIHENDHDDDDDDTSSIDVEMLILSVYERGISECPCIERLWLSYIRELQSWVQPPPHPSNATTSSDVPPQRRRQQLALERLPSVTHRAVRNCPYSIPILQQQLESVLVVTTTHRKYQRDEPSTRTYRPPHPSSPITYCPCYKTHWIWDSYH